MSDTRSFRLTGTVHAIAPVAIALVGNAPTSPHDPMPVPSTSIWSREHGLVQTAYIPSTSLRGALRRCARDVLFDLLHPDGESRWDLDTLYLQTIGGVIQKGAGESPTLDVTVEIEERARNPLVSLLGAANTGRATFIAGRLELGHALPAAPLSPESCPIYPAMRTDDMRRDPAAMLPMLDADGPQRWSLLYGQMRETSELKARQRDLKREAVKARKAGDTETLAQANAELDRVREALKSGTTSVAMPAAGFQALPQGLELAHEIRLMGVTEEELGLFLEALDRFSLAPLIGGQRARGCGEVALSYELAEIGGETIGEVRVGGFAPAVLPDHPAIAAARKAFAAGRDRYEPSFGGGADNARESA